MAPLPPQSSTAAQLPGSTNAKANFFQNRRESSLSVAGPGGSSHSGVAGSFIGSANATKGSHARQIFDRYDKDGSGAISISEFRSLCYDMGYFLTDQELSLDIKLLDVDGNGTLSYDEFIKWWKKDDRFLSLQLNEEEIEKLNKYLAHFKRFDKDGSGIIDIREFKSLYADLVKRKLAKKSLMATMQDLDFNKDGKVSFNEYVQWALKNCSDCVSNTTPAIAE